MTGDELNLIAKAALGAVILAFAPQIMRWLRRMGYRDMNEKPPDKQPDNPETRS